MGERIVCFDIETGGLGPRHPIIQIAAVALDATWSEVDAFERKVRFDPSAADPAALELNSYDEATWRAEAVDEEQAAMEFADFCRRHATMTLVSRRTGKPYLVARLAGHNVQEFDVPRVRRWLDRLGIFWPACWWHPLDTYAGAIWHFARTREAPPGDFKLATLAAWAGVGGQQAHDALGDVRTAAGLARRLLA